MANALRAGFQRIVQRARPTPVGSRLRVTRYKHFRAACSVGKCPRARTARRYRALSDSIALVEKITFPIDWMCRKLKVSRASFYRWLRPNVPTPTQVRHDLLDAHVVRVFAREKDMAGRDQITTILGQEGVSIATGTVGSILTDHGLRAVRMRAWKKTTTVDPLARTEHIQNHMQGKEGTRDFTSTTPGTRFCGDITYLRTGSGWLYLATVIDLCTRMVVGWSITSHMRTSLIIDAMEMARDHGHFDVNGAIFHSDRAAQDTSGDFQKWCAANAVTQSMGAVGTCWDCQAIPVGSDLDSEVLAIAA